MYYYVELDRTTLNGTAESKGSKESFSWLRVLEAYFSILLDRNCANPENFGSNSKSVNNFLNDLVHIPINQRTP